MQSEFAFINRIRAQAAYRPARGLVCGIGDDAAVFGEQTGRETLATADLLIEDVHFKLEYAPPRMLGHKALAVSLSDIAAMGGEPRFALLSLGLPQAAIHSPQADEFWEEFFAGYLTLAEKYGVTLIGGDTSASPDKLVIDSVVMGGCAAGRAVRRSGARLGDAIFVTGKLGGSAAGLQLLQRGARVQNGIDDATQRALRAHLMPQPRIEFGRMIGERTLAHTMMDVSDGLAQDLAHICEESGTAAVIDFDAVPVAAETALVTESAQAQFNLAIGGGEDYELLLTAAPQSANALHQAARECRVELTRIGEIIARGRESHSSLLLLRRGAMVEPMVVHGYDHFGTVPQH